MYHWEHDNGWSAPYTPNKGQPFSIQEDNRFSGGRAPG
ncbi:hypothetical protein Krac_0657 [Ktedonobacter racemifer DSM 44963]|uniref:Uncharacterized protein n=1 Tax=Ktedonobacter racemifer DSM 44963 TaxID=485913 RepID=D6U893_KTERA|nr:hypothetical protein Krac_0657 [Ktedonobacter racemifer DSM 44963]